MRPRAFVEARLTQVVYLRGDGSPCQAGGDERLNRSATSGFAHFYFAVGFSPLPCTVTKECTTWLHIPCARRPECFSDGFSLGTRSYYSWYLYVSTKPGHGRPRPAMPHVADFFFHTLTIDATAFHRLSGATPRERRANRPNFDAAECGRDGDARRGVIEMARDCVPRYFERWQRRIRTHLPPAFAAAFAAIRLWFRLVDTAVRNTTGQEDCEIAWRGIGGCRRREFRGSYAPRRGSWVLVVMLVGAGERGESTEGCSMPTRRARLW